MDNNGNNPNINMFPLEKAENGINQASCALLEIEPVNEQQLALKNLCLAEIKEFQDGSLLALRRSLE